jgi:hypothetical protein
MWPIFQEQPRRLLGRGERVSPQANNENWTSRIWTIFESNFRNLEWKYVIKYTYKLRTNHYSCILNIANTATERLFEVIYDNYQIVWMNASANHAHKKGKTITVTGRGGPYGCETSRLPHFLDNWLIDGDEVVSFTHWPSFIPRKIPRTHFC